MSTHDRTTCRECGAYDPIHLNRHRPRDRRLDVPPRVNDTLRCTGCGHEWVDSIEEEQP